MRIRGRITVSIASITSVVAVLLGLAAPTHAQTVVYDPANWFENLVQRLESITARTQRARDLVEQLEQKRQQYEQLVTMVRNLKDFEQLESRQLATMLYVVQSLIGELDGIIYIRQDVDARWREFFRIEPRENLRDANLERAKKTLESLRAVMLATHRVGKISVKSQQDLGAAKGQLDRSEGALQALQAVGIVASHTSEEVSRAVELAAASNNALAAYFGHELSARMTAEATFRQWLEQGYRPAPSYGDGVVIPVLPAGFPR